MQIEAMLQKKRFVQDFKTQWLKSFDRFRKQGNEHKVCKMKRRVERASCKSHPITLVALFVDEINQVYYVYIIEVK